jgi:small subunit ribosomal protein S1
MVIKYNDEKKRISLGIKQLEDNPWKGYDAKYPVGTVVKGKVTDFADYGAFVQIDGEENVEGLVYYSEISWSKTHQNPKKLLSPGQEVECKVLEVDVDKHRISLSIKQCLDNPWVKFAQETPVGSIIKGEVRNVADFGIFVAIGPEIDGMVRDIDIAKGVTGPEALKNYNKGDIVECRVLSIDVEKEKVSLGIKQLEGDFVAEAGSNESGEDLPVGDYKKGEIYTCTVLSTDGTGVEVALADGTKGFVKKTDLSSEKSEQKTDRFVPGDRFDAKVLSVSKQKGLVNLSVKALEIEEREKAIKEYGSADSGASLGDILGAALGQTKK